MAQSERLLVPSTEPEPANKGQRYLLPEDSPNLHGLFTAR